jgi:hypothetical protein
MIVLFIILLVVYGVLGAAGFVYAKRRKALYWSDVVAPVLVIIFWVGITSTGYGHQSLSHVVEVPIALAITLVLFNIRVFAIDRFSINYRVNSYSVLGVSLLSVLLIRTFMPYLPE